MTELAFARLRTIVRLGEAVPAAAHRVFFAKLRPLCPLAAGAFARLLLAGGLKKNSKNDPRRKSSFSQRAKEEKAKQRAKAAEKKAVRKEGKAKNKEAKKATPAFKLEEERRAKVAAELREQEERAARLAAEQEAARRAEREAAELAGAAEQAALREDAELVEAMRRSEVDAEEALARRVSRCEEAVSSESTGGGGDLQRRVDQLEASLGAATEGSLEERVGAIERLIGPEAAEAVEPHPPVTEPFAAVSLADAGLDTGRPVAPESTMGGETSCIICFERPKSHLAVPCSHLCVCGPCSELMQECPYCREPVMIVARPAPGVILSLHRDLFQS
ncbi:hypothetical protein EMIHUDRAFT_220382 [Emiliania huxleyi CCMP1516]|uniref:RING-type domain-containing protein n=2 Tax=Emiliania huxleyi TaxID=2903 RepID=A0A0D3I115_EMIH1|nr:hypothetical protein EMIHUDRAFT_220382 [Emiliania huxleyi CCMP1516]EOD04950.1 hypothetical protein EMIHUDRAFT_220382 [Emiliania huxleyi CCMP1516]|eukprot:XP_005757379.1 hypothetical protein EMIHUDRAFT_220382 [Emiliania huxleyi CCMP1516]